MRSADLAHQRFVLGSQHRAGALGKPANHGECVQHHLQPGVDEWHERGFGFAPYVAQPGAPEAIEQLPPCLWICADVFDRREASSDHPLEGGERGETGQAIRIVLLG